MNDIALQLRLGDIVAEYNQKVAGAPHALAALADAETALKTASCIGGTLVDLQYRPAGVSERDVLASLLKSAWRHVYRHLQIDRLASASDKRLFDQSMTSPPPFTMENIKASLGKYILDPRANILRGLAEVFSDLDPAYKSHEKVKIGVAGLPKRIILTGFGEYSFGSWGRDKLRDVLNALAALQGKPLVEYAELAELMKDEDALIVSRGIRLRRFINGNGHLFFEPETLRDINRALAEYYGDVLADCSDDEPKQKRAGTAVAKDLQYYPTPSDVVDRVLANIHDLKGARVLEPSCGCGRFLDALRRAGANAIGIEVDPDRASACKAKGHNVLVANFLETVPTADFDRVVMNPPFYGQHYAKHVRHALGFLRPGGTLTAILPITARYDHGALDDLISGQGHWRTPWDDLPVGSFSESGTNINTAVLTLHRPAEQRASAA